MAPSSLEVDPEDFNGVLLIVVTELSRPPPPAVIGLLYPCIDSRVGEPHRFKREWSSVMRCVAVFVGINHASAVSFQKC